MKVITRVGPTSYEKFDHKFRNRQLIWKWFVIGIAIVTFLAVVYGQ